MEVKVLQALKAKGYPWHETIDHVTDDNLRILLIIDVCLLPCLLQQRFVNGIFLSSSVDFGRYAILQLRNEVGECVRVTVEIKLLCPRVNAVSKHTFQLL